MFGAAGGRAGAASTSPWMARYSGPSSALGGSLGSLVASPFLFAVALSLHVARMATDCASFMTMQHVTMCDTTVYQTCVHACWTPGALTMLFFPHGRVGSCKAAARPLQLPLMSIVPPMQHPQADGAAASVGEA
jgi:hypothetical protein